MSVKIVGKIHDANHPVANSLIQVTNYTDSM